jgi:Glycosyl hydrolases family 28/Divergent InlB B-repeat domain/Bacterial Ig domain
MSNRFPLFRNATLFRLGLVALTGCFLTAGRASASITLDASSNSFGVTGTTSLAFTHALGIGSGRLVVCGVQIANPAGAVANVAPTVTFGGFTMTAIPGSQAPTSAESNTSKIESEMFYLNDTTLGTTSGPVAVNVTLPSAPTGGVGASCSSFFGMAQSAPEAFGGAYNGAGVAQTISLTTATAGDLVIDSYAGGFTASTNPTKSASPNSGQTMLTDSQLSTAGILGGSSYEIAGAPGSISVGWTNTISRLAYSAVAFAPTATVNYTVTTSASPLGGGTVTLSPSQLSYASGSSVTVTATPAPYYLFTGFSGDLTGTTNPATVTVNANMNITANFTQAMCTLTLATTGQGTVTPASGSYACGSTINLTATPVGGYSFAQWSGSGYTGTSSSASFVLTSNTTETASFVQGTTCTLATNVTGSGSITVSPSGGAYSCGTALTVTAVPSSSDWSFTGFSGALTGTANPQTLTLNANSTVSAAFTQVNFPVNVTVVGPGTVTADPSASSYAQGTQVQLTATPNSGAYFAGFSGDVTSTTSPATVTVNTTKNITATFVNSVITQDAVSHAVSTGSTSVLSWTHTLGSGSSRAVVIAIGSADSVASPDANAVVTSVLFNGVYATPIPNSLIYGGTSGMVQTQLFYLTDAELPAAGTYTVQVNLAGSVGGVQAGAISLFGVNQGPPEAVVTHRDTTGADLINTPITTLTNNAWVIDAVEDNNVTGLTANAGQTVAWSQSSTGTGTGGSSTLAVPTAGTTTLGWAGSASRLAHSLAAFPTAGTIVPATYALTTSVVGGGTVTTNPGITQFPTQTGVLLTATPSVGYSFSGWSGDFTSNANPLPIVMDTNHSVVANFTTAPTCTVTFTIVGQGTVTPATGGVYNCGTSLTLTATPALGYSFTSWSGDFTSTDNPATFTLNANSNVTVEFDPIPQCTLTMTTVGTGTLSPGSGTYACGSTINLKATQTDPAWPFSGFTGDFTGTANPASVTLNGNMSITGTFVQGSTCTLTTTVTGSGTVTPNSASYLCGTQISIAAVPSAHYLFGGWGGALSGSTTPATLMLTGTTNVTATFDYNTAGVTGDMRTVTEPAIPPVCSVLTAQQILSSPVETSPDTSRVQAALNACPSGQAVEFSASPDGVNNAFIIAPITLPAGVTMLVDAEVTILASIKSTDYACISSESWCTPLIDVAPNTYPATGSAIMGDGVIDGRGGTTLTDLNKSWWATGSDARPRLVFLSSHSNNIPADNFTMYKITLKNSPKFHFSGIGNDLTIWGIKIIAPPDSPNTDGIDPSSSQNITITNSYFSDGDDMIAMKAGNGHIANVTINNNHMYSGHGITIGSETNAGLNNMFVHDNSIDNGFGGSSVDSLRIKSDTSRGGEVYDVLYKNICINNGGDTIVIDPYYSSETGSLYPNFHDITFSNVHKLIHDSSHKSTMTGYNTGGIVYPLTVAMDNVVFDNDTANDFKAPSNFNNVQFGLGAGPVSFAAFLVADAAVPSNLITVANNISNSNAPYDCTNAFVYLAGDLTASTNSAVGGSPFTATAVLQNLVSPLMAGTISYPQQRMPTGTIQLLEGSTVVGTGTIASGNRLTYITIPSIPTGTHTYNAQYQGDTNYPALNFGSFTVVAVSAVPVANSQSVSVAYNTVTPITLAASGSGTLIYSVVNGPTNGTIAGTAPNLTYTPTSGYVGTDSFTFKANNGTDSNVATVNITVKPATPVAVNQALSVVFNTPTTISLNATGSGTLVYSIVAAPTNGTLSGTVPNLTYTPTSGFSGSDSFTFKANNGTDSNVATVTIAVQPAVPVANSQSVTVSYNTATQIILTATGSGTMTYAVLANPSHGVLSGTLPNLTYTPTSGYVGTDRFTFKANNGTDSNVATVNIIVQPAAPIANGQSVTVAYNIATPITLSAAGNGTLSYSVVSSPLHGTLSGTAPNLTYTPAAGYSGFDNFSFKANNGTDSNVAAISITVVAAVNPAPAANSQSVTASFNTPTPVTLTATGSGTLVYSIVTQPTHGTLSAVSGASVTYTPTTGYAGTDSFTFKANNSIDSNIATVSLTVNGDLTWSTVSGTTTATVSAGQTATYLLQIAGWTGANAGVSFTCTGAPQYSNCSVTPNSITLNGTATIPITVTVTTQSNAAVIQNKTIPSSRRGLPIAMMAGLLGCFAGMGRLKGKRAWNVLASCVVLAVMFTLSGCGGGAPATVSSNTVSGTYALGVTATSGAITKTLPLTLVIH